MKALDRKLVRDLARMRAQVITIALVLASGVGAILSLMGTYRALSSSRDAYYERHGMPDVFASLSRAPDAVADRLRAIPGVVDVVTRLVEPLTFEIPGLAKPAAGRAVSLPDDGGAPSLRGLVLVRGRPPDPGRDDEALLLRTFADAHGLEPGDRVDVVVRGRRLRLRIAGVVLSPEWIFPAQGGFASDRMFGVVWLPRPTLEAASGKHGAFSDVTLRLAPGASERAVIDAVDRVLRPWGGLGAYARADQISNKFLTGEIQQLQVLATQVPIVFLLVAAFLLHVTLDRTVHLQREQIAVLRALGYTRWAIGRHVLAFAAVIVVGGGAAGVAIGALLGGAMTDLYARYFHFPVLEFRLDGDLVGTALVVCAAAATVGGLAAMWRAVRLAPAEAMRPPVPATYRRGLLSRLGLARLAGRSGRMIVREIERKPVAFGISVVGIAFAGAMVILGRFGLDSFRYMLDVPIARAMREDVAVALIDPVPRADLGWFAHAPGVIAVEPLREVPVRLRAAHLRYDTVLTGLERGGRLRRVLDGDAEPVAVPARGLLLGEALADRLGVGVGDLVTVERKDGDHRTLAVTVTALTDERTGMNAYMDLDALARALGEEPMASTALLQIERGARAALLRALADVPAVAAIVEVREIRDAMEKQTGEVMWVWVLITFTFSAVIAVGVIYNNARIALSERGRDLATLRVLGYTRDEVATVLLGQLAVNVVVAIPLGLAFGYGLATVFMASMDPEQFRYPAIVAPETYGLAAMITIGSMLVTSIVVRRRLDAIDLVSALKARD